MKKLICENITKKSILTYKCALQFTSSDILREYIEFVFASQILLSFFLLFAIRIFLTICDFFYFKWVSNYF